jgi:hypothetical protein
VVAELGADGVDVGRRDAEAGHRPYLPDRAVPSSIDRHGLAVVQDLRVVEALFAEAAQLESDVGLRQQRPLPVFVGLRHHRFPHQVFPGGGVVGRRELRLFGEAWVVDGVLESARP